MLTATLAAEIRRRTSGENRYRTPLVYIKLPEGFRLSIADKTDDLELFKEDQPEERVILGYVVRDNWGTKWMLNPNWQKAVRNLVQKLGLEREPEPYEIPF